MALTGVHSENQATIAEIYIDINPFHGMVPATVSVYRLGGRRYA